jgi:hypothetical protein
MSANQNEPKKKIARGNASDWSAEQIAERATVTDELIEATEEYLRERASPVLSDIERSEEV